MCGGGPGQGVGAGGPARSRRSAGAARRCARPARPLASGGSPGRPGRRARRRARPGVRGRRPRAHCEPIEPRRRPTCDGPGVAVVGQGVEVAARGPTEHRHQRGLGQRGRPRRPSRMPRSWSLAAVTGPTPHSRSTGSGCRKASSPSGGTTSSPSGLATPLATLARNLVRATPTVMAQADPLEHLAPQPHGDLRRRARDPPQAADVEEGLVDGEALDEGRGVVEHLEHRLAGLGVGRASAARRRRRAGHSRRAWRAAHGRAHAEGLGLVAGGQHHAAAHDAPAGPAGADRRAARPTRRTRRGRRAGWSPRPARTHVRTSVSRSATATALSDGSCTARCPHGRRQVQLGASAPSVYTRSRR